MAVTLDARNSSEVNGYYPSAFASQATGAEVQLRDALKSGNMAMVAQLINSRSVSINWVDPSNGWSFLHYAVASPGSYGAIEYLVKAGIDVRLTSKDHKTAFQLMEELNPDLNFFSEEFASYAHSVKWLIDKASEELEKHAAQSSFKTVGDYTKASEWLAAGARIHPLLGKISLHSVINLRPEDQLRFFETLFSDHPWVQKKIENGDVDLKALMGHEEDGVKPYELYTRLASLPNIRTEDRERFEKIAEILKANGAPGSEEPEEEPEEGPEEGKDEGEGQYGPPNANWKRPPGDKRTVEEIFRDYPVLANLQKKHQDWLKFGFNEWDNGNHQKPDNPFTGIGDWDDKSKYSDDERADMAYRAAMVLEHVQKYDEQGRLLPDQGREDMGNIHGFTRDNEARNDTEAGRFQDFCKYGWSYLKGGKEKPPATEGNGPGSPGPGGRATYSADLSYLDEYDIMMAETTLEIDGKKATVNQYIFSKLIEKYMNMDLDENDPRFKFIRSFTAVVALENGMEITPFVEDVRWAGAHTSRQEGKKKWLTPADMAAFIDGDKAYEMYSLALSSDEVKADYEELFSEALDHVEDLDARRKKLRDLIKNPAEFLDYIRKLKASGKEDIAEIQIQRMVATINALLPEDEAADAVMSLIFGATGADLDELLENPDQIETKYYTQAIYDMIAMMMRASSLTVGSIRRTLEVLRALNNSSPDALAAVFRELQKALLEVDATTTGNHGELKAEAVTKALDRALGKLGNKIDAGKFRTTFLDLNKAGLLGSFVGGIGVATGIMKLTAWDTSKIQGQDGLIDGREYAILATARDFINALSLNGAFLMTSDSLLKLIKMGGLVDMLGLAGTLPEIWGKDGVLKEYRSATSAVATSIAKGLESHHPVDVSGSDDPKAKGYVERAFKKLGINAVAPKVLTTAIGTTLRVLGSIADVTLGVVDIVLGALALRGKISGLPSTGGLQIIAGVFELTAGVAGTFAMFGKGGNWAKAIMFGSLSVALGLTLLSFVGAIAIKDQEDRFDAQLQWFNNLAGSRLLKGDWAEKLEYAMYSLYEYGERGAPEDISIFDFQWSEYAHFKRTPQKHGSSKNRLNGNLRFKSDGSNWVPPGSRGSDDASQDWYDRNDPLKGLTGTSLDVVLYIYINHGIVNSKGERIFLDPSDYSRKLRWNEDKEHFEDVATGAAFVWNKDAKRYEPKTA